MSDAKYFTTTKKGLFFGYSVLFFLHRLCASHFLTGEIFELKSELNSDKKDKRKEAVKKVIASMTVGKDVR